MSNIVSTNAIEAALMKGDLSSLTPDQRLSYYKSICESVGLNPLTKPFEYIEMNRKLVLYATKGCAEQLRMKHKISIKVIDKQKIDEVYVVTAEASNSDGRVDSSTGAVSIAGLKGDALANALMKAETKAKRRVTLSICGLNMLDETEVESVASAVKEINKESFLDHEISDGQYEPGKYVATFGMYKGQKLEDVEIFKLNDYVTYIEKTAKNEGKTLNGKVLEFLNVAKDFLNSRDVSKKSPA